MANWSRTFRGEAANAAEVRAWTRDKLIDAYGEKGDDLAYPIGHAATELFSNAIFHTASGLKGGTVMVSLRLDGPEDVRLSVTDEGTAKLPTEGIDDPQREGGRGGSIIDAFATEKVIAGDAETGHTVTARFTTATLEHPQDLLFDEISL
jgi:two-component sensor histidine kinase